MKWSSKKTSRRTSFFVPYVFFFCLLAAALFLSKAIFFTCMPIVCCFIADYQQWNDPCVKIWTLRTLFAIFTLFSNCNHIWHLILLISSDEKSPLVFKNVKWSFEIFLFNFCRNFSTILPNNYSCFFLVCIFVIQLLCWRWEKNPASKNMWFINFFNLIFKNSVFRYQI